eukprot:3057087-Rhodomonas_salina.1
MELFAESVSLVDHSMLTDGAVPCFPAQSNAPTVPVCQWGSDMVPGAHLLTNPPLAPPTGSMY